MNHSIQSMTFRIVTFMMTCYDRCEFYSPDILVDLSIRVGHPEFFNRNTFGGRANSCRPHWVLLAGHLQWTRQLVSATLSSSGGTPPMDAPSSWDIFDGRVNSCQLPELSYRTYVYLCVFETWPNQRYDTLLSTIKSKSWRILFTSIW